MGKQSSKNVDCTACIASGDLVIDKVKHTSIHADDDAGTGCAVPCPCAADPQTGRRHVVQTEFGETESRDDAIHHIEENVSAHVPRESNSPLDKLRIDFPFRDGRLHGSQFVSENSDISRRFESAVRAAQFKAVVDLLDVGANPLGKTVRGLSMLMIIAGSHFATTDVMAIAGILLEAKVNLEEVDAEGNTALLHGCLSGHDDLVYFLMEARANPGAQNQKGVTPLINAVLGNKINSVQRLIEARVSQNIGDGEGWTPLMYACWSGRNGLVKCLLRSKASYKERSVDRTTPLMISASQGHLEVAKLLLQRRAKINSSNNEGKTAVYLSTFGCHPTVVRELLDAHADATIPDHDGVQVHEIALEKKLGMFADRMMMQVADVMVKKKDKALQKHRMIRDTIAVPSRFSCIRVSEFGATSPISANNKTPKLFPVGGEAPSSP